MSTSFAFSSPSSAANAFLASVLFTEGPLFCVAKTIPPAIPTTAAALPARTRGLSKESPSDPAPPDRLDGSNVRPGAVSTPDVSSLALETFMVLRATQCL